MKNVLVFPCGTEIGLELRRALHGSTHFKVFGGSSVDDHGKFAYENYIPDLPFIDAPEFVDRINVVVEQRGIDFVFPAHDAAVLTLAEQQKRIKAPVVTSRVETCRICRSKAATYRLFSGIVPTPIIYGASDEMQFPVFLKPDVGQGSKGTYRADDMEEVGFFLKRDPSLLRLEYLPGREYTVDCFTDRHGALLFTEGRERKRIYNGISVNSSWVRDPRFRKIAARINSTLSFRGVWFFQLKERSDGELVLMEIAPRMAGTMALFRADGVNFAQLSLFDRMGVDVSILRNGLEVEVDRSLSTRFSIRHSYTWVYIDFDDTIVVAGAVNADIMRLMYQFRNNGKKIVLLSRHRENIYQSLEKYSISPLLFEKIVVMGRTEAKSDHIVHVDSIFIDDSFSERKEVSQKRGVPVFALDAVESLMTIQAA